MEELKRIFNETISWVKEHPEEFKAIAKKSNLDESALFMRACSEDLIDFYTNFVNPDYDN